ncbi:MAG: hypothetical protein WC842_02270 [Candidatus Paceibacterota bacterium]|jgi:hypothetical protein
MRQTNLTLSELISIIDGKMDTYYPICLILNEIGEIYISKSGEDTSAAENTLVSILSSANVFNQQIALSYLLLKEPREENKQAIKDYISKNLNVAGMVRQVLNVKKIEPWFIF